MAPKPNNNALPPKEQNLFKAVVRFYETKQLKKALKTADTILKRFPDHGETLAMKGLTLNALDKKVEATDLVRKGLRLDMKSHICWHVYGLLYRSERDYREAAKAYLNALRIDKDNQQILRDLALLQIQIRDYEGLEETRRKLLTVRPNQRNNWIGFALSYHFLGNFTSAVSVLDTYQDTLKQSNEPDDRFEVSELLLYKNFLLEESADYAAALSHLDQNIHKLIDRLAVRETRARLLCALGQYSDAAEELKKLLLINPDNHVYIRALQACAIWTLQPDRAVNGTTEPPHLNTSGVPSNHMKAFGIRKLAILQKRTLGPLPSIVTDADVSSALDVCNQLTVEHPFSRSAQRLALDVLPTGNHPQFLPRVDAYVRPFLRKGIPALFSDVKPLYADSSKVAVFGSLFETFREMLENEDVAELPPPSPMPDGDNVEFPVGRKRMDNTEEPSCTLLWVLHFLAQHYDRLGQRELALKTIEQAIEHTPETIECYLVKAHILKHCGDLKGAVKVADEGRNLDLADRYLNTKCCKYGLRADMVEEAEAWVGLFMRDGDSGGVQALYDMQCMWFELGAAESHLRRGQLPQALKKFTAVERHFADMVEDQFDFHSYCLRKVTLRAYVNLLRFEDDIRCHPYYARAAEGLVKCLLRLFDMPERDRVLIAGEHSDIQGYADMSDSERKKALSKRRKHLARLRQTQHGSGSGKASGKPATNGGEKVQAGASDAKQQSSASNSENKPKGNPGWMEVDVVGVEYIKELLKGEKKEGHILREATKVIREMLRFLGTRIETQELAFELAMRRKKYLQALRAVRRAQSLNIDDPRVLMMAIKFSYEVKKGLLNGASDIVRAVYDLEGDVLQGMSIHEYISCYLKRNSGHAQRRVGVHRVLMFLARVKFDGSGTVGESCESLIKAIEESEGDGVGKNVVSFSFCSDLVEELKMERLNIELLGKVKGICQKKHPRAKFG